MEGHVWCGGRRRGRRWPVAVICVQKIGRDMTNVLLRSQDLTHDSRCDCEDCSLLFHV